MAEITLEDFGRYMSVNQGLMSPLLERGASGVPSSVPVLSAKDLRSLSTQDTDELLQYLEQFGVIDTPDKLIEAAAVHLQRFNIGPDDPRYAAEMERLTDAQSGNLLLGQARRVSERYETLMAVDGDMTINMIYLAEGEDPCEECAELNGIEGTYEELLAADTLPGSRCLGKHKCQCVLVPFT